MPGPPCPYGIMVVPADNKAWAYFNGRLDMKLLWSWPKFVRATRIRSIRPNKKKRPAVKTCVPIEHKKEECTSTQVRTRTKTSSAVPIHHCATQEFCENHTRILFGMAPRLLKDRGPSVFFCEIDMRLLSVGNRRRGVRSLTRASSRQSCRRRQLNSR